MSTEADATGERPSRAEGNCATLRLEHALVIYDSRNHNAWIQSSEPREIPR